MYPLLEHPEISCALRTGYPSWMQERDDGEEEFDEDAAYEERRHRELFGGDD
jgi:hypothetical protein